MVHILRRRREPQADAATPHSATDTLLGLP